MEASRKNRDVPATFSIRRYNFFHTHSNNTLEIDSEIWKVLREEVVKEGTTKR